MVQYEILYDKIDIMLTMHTSSQKIAIISVAFTTIDEQRRVKKS